MDVLFLDFDGVLNDCATEPEFELEEHEFGSEMWGAAQLKPEFVARVNQIVDATGAVVVLTTSWANVFSTRWLRAVLKIAGFTGNVIGTTPGIDAVAELEERVVQTSARLIRKDGESDEIPIEVLKGIPEHRTGREYEIEAWLKAVGPAVDCYVILDDMPMGHLQHRAVTTIVQLGIQPADVFKAIRLFIDKVVEMEAEGPVEPGELVTFGSKPNTVRRARYLRPDER